MLAVLVGGVAAAAVWDDVGGGRLWFRRRALPHRPTWNVVAETGDPDAARTVVFIAHHDAAHSGLVFHPALPRIGMRLAPRLHERANQSVPILFGVFLGPLLLRSGGSLGRRWLRRAGICFSRGRHGRHGGHRREPRGARGERQPERGGRARGAGPRAPRAAAGGRARDLLSTGSEEASWRACRRSGGATSPSCDRATTEFVCLECVGSPHLCVVEAEGMLRMRHYPEASREALARGGRDAGVS